MTMLISRMVLPDSRMCIRWRVGYFYSNMPRTSIPAISIVYTSIMRSRESLESKMCVLS